MITTRQTPLSVALGAACLWLKRRTDLRANPELLLEFTCAWVAAVKPSTVWQARQCGIAAVKEIAGCKTEIEFEKWLNPEDLRDEL